MFQTTSKTTFNMKIMVCKIPPGGETLSGHWPIRDLQWKCKYIHVHMKLYAHI